MDLLIKNAGVIAGDGEKIIEKAFILIKKNRIEGLESGDPGDEVCGNVMEIIDATGCYVIPGVINAHAHGCTIGPLFPSGALPLSREKAKRNADRMLLQGVTTLINVCGLGVLDDLESINSLTPMNIKTGTCHVPSAIKSALSVDGKGLEKRHIYRNAVEMVEHGAVVVGEMGSGASLGGGVTDYKYIPEAVFKKTGLNIDARQAASLKESILGRKISKDYFDPDKTGKLMDELDLTGRISLKNLRKLVEKVALEPISISLDSFDEGCRAASETGVPVVFHNAVISAEKILHLAEHYLNRNFYMVAGHSNHPSFTVEESVQYARKLKERGVVIDISSLDGIITRWMNSPESIEALVSEGLADTISTDYGAGHWDSILETIHHLYRKGILSLSKGVAMAAGNVARIHPLASPDRGFVKKGKIADLVITDDKNIGRVETVIISGRIVADGGWCRY